MNEFNKIQRSEALFIHKLSHMIEKYPQIINWCQKGNKMIIFNIKEMQNRILPEYFRHKKFSSFFRQLNTYDFKKEYDNGNQIAFSNHFFKRGNQKNFYFIQRKKNVKNQLINSSQFEQKNQSLLNLLKNLPVIDQGTMKCIQSILQFKHTSYEKTKKICKQIEKLENQTKQFHHRGLYPSIKKMMDNQIFDLKQQLKISKQIDVKLENQLLSCKQNQLNHGKQHFQETQIISSFLTSSDKHLDQIIQFQCDQNELYRHSSDITISRCRSNDFLYSNIQNVYSYWNKNQKDEEMKEQQEQCWPKINQDQDSFQMSNQTLPKKISNRYAKSYDEEKQLNNNQAPSIIFT